MPDTAESVRQVYERTAPQHDPEGFQLFFAAQEVTGIRRLWEEFPYEDACGCFEFADGRQLLRYLTAARFGAVSWETVPGTTYERAVLREVDTSTPEYRAFEKQIYERPYGAWASRTYWTARPGRGRRTRKRKTRYMQTVREETANHV